MYAFELLSEVISHDHKGNNWLYCLKDYGNNLKSTDAIKELLDIFENIVWVTSNQELKPEHVNRLMSQLTNIIKIARALNENELAEVKNHLSLLRSSELFNPEFFPSPGFSQEGEDLILKRLLPTDKKGFYVDVGAHHPIRFSNTYLFYKMGWRGINIDPRPGIMDIFNAIRPDDINIEVAIGSGESRDQHINYISFEEAAYNSVYIKQENEVANLESSKIIDTRKVAIRSLDDVLKEHSDAFTKINLLSIDVEGFERQVLKGFSIEKYRPDVIVLEIRGFDLSNRDSFEEYKTLTDKGYKLRSILYNSLIFQFSD